VEWNWRLSSSLTVVGSVFDRARTEAERHELCVRHAVLDRRQFGQFRVGCAELGLTMRLNAAHRCALAP
jgi:hypothetical protein